MIRQLLQTFIIFTLVTGIASAQETSEFLPELKASASVDDTVITLGDVFNGLTDHTDMVVGNAPEPGKKLLLSARYILKLTRSNNIRWRNSGNIKNVVVSRVSNVISYGELAPMLKDQLANAYQTSGRLDVRFYNQNGKIHLPNGFDVNDLTIKNLSVDRKSEKFSALVNAPTGQGNHTQHVVNGRILKVAMVPSLARTIRRGEVIKSSDIKWISLPDNQVGRNIVRSKTKLIGMTPRSQIKEGAPIRLSEVNRPVLVKRGDLVKIHFNTNRINLTTVGKAVENGGKGDVIQVKNNSSNKVISAIVLAPNQVQVNVPNNTLVLLDQ